LIYTINPETEYVKSFPTIGYEGCVSLNNNEELFSAEKEGIYSIDPNSGSRSFINQFEANEEMRYNDGTTDSMGRFLVGT
jgi:sugar lactone lactonase YvrE